MVVRVGDGSLGAPERAPFGGISVTATARDEPPPALLRWPGNLILLTVAAVVLVTIVAAWLVQRSADRGNVAELMRLAE